MTHPAPEAGSVLELTLGKAANGGSNVARPAPDAKVVFVEGGVEGERVRARITRAKPAEGFMRATVTEVLEASPDRRPHPWPAADPLTGSVGGAELGHVVPERQRQIKAEAANDALVRIGRFPAEDLQARGLLPERARGVAIPSGSAGARTRVAFAVGPGGALGMHPSGSNAVVPVEDMPLAVDRLRAPELFDLDFTGLERVELAAGSHDVLVLLVPEAARRQTRGPRGGARRAPRPPHRLSEGQLRELADEVHEILGARVAAWWPVTGRLLPLVGPAELTQDVDFGDGSPRSFRVTGDGFWQIHEGAPEALSRAVISLMDVREGDRVADLYAGAGLFTGALLAAAGRAQVSIDSIEAYPVTSDDAARTFRADPRVAVVNAKVEDALPGRSYDAVVLDPSRAGAGERAIAAIDATGARTVVYVSCDAGSFARDARLLTDRGFTLDRRELFDIYPDTHHVETVARFTRGVRR